MASYEYVIVSGHEITTSTHYHTQSISAINNAAANTANIPANAIIDSVKVYFKGYFSWALGMVGNSDLYFYFCNDDDYKSGIKLLDETLQMDSREYPSDISSYVSKTYPFNINTSYPRLSVYHDSTTRRKYHCELFRVVYNYSIPTYTLTVNSNNNNYGTVTGGGNYNNQTIATLTATANTGYAFKQWNDGNTENPRLVTVTNNVTYTAEFEKAISTITVLSSGNGTVSGSGTYINNAQATLTATPDNGYKFKQWSDNNNKDNPRTIIVTNDATYTAIFEPITYYTVFDLNGGTLSWDNSPISHSYGDSMNLGSYGFAGEDVTATYEAQGGNYFCGAETMPRPLVGWEDLGSIKIGDTTYTSDTFDAPYYANKYPNLYTAYGYDKYALALHYHTTGKDRGEQCINTEGDKARGLYPNGAQVSHLTNIDGHIVPLKCRWGEVTVTLGTPTKKGYEFLGWTDGTNTYQAGETVSLIKSTTFTAQWKPNNIFVGNTPAQGVYVGDKPAKAIYKGTTLIYEK